MKLTLFQKSVLGATRKIPKGRIATYKDVAKAINQPKAMRAVGNALNKNPWAPRVPCHRVIKSNGEAGGFAGGTKKKIEILEKEGIIIKRGKIINYKKIRATI